MRGGVLATTGASARASDVAAAEHLTLRQHNNSFASREDPGSRRINNRPLLTALQERLPAVAKF